MAADHGRDAGGSWDDSPEGQEIKRIMAGTSFQEMRALSATELVRRIDLISSSQGFLRGPDDYLNELTRRETERQSKRIEWLTWALVALTIVITVATVALLVRGN